MNYQHEADTISGILERHVLEDPEYHEKTDELGEGTGVLSDPHCDWCWADWPCEFSQLAHRMREIEIQDQLGEEEVEAYLDTIRKEQDDGES